MKIMFDSIMTATRMPAIFPFLRDEPSKRFDPFRYLRCYRDFQKFRSLDSHMLRDIGLTEEDVRRTGLTDFLRR